MAGREEADWKNQPYKSPNIVAILLVLALVVADIYIGYTADASYYIGIAGIHFVFLVLYLTSYWQPILYIVAVMAGIAFSTVILLDGFTAPPADEVALVINGIIIILSISLFFREEVGL